MSESITIDAVGPMPVVRPTSAAEVGDIVRRCAADETAIYPVGGGTMLDYGMPPARPGVGIEVRALDKIIDFPASDMTITVEAGITIARLAEITRAEGLHLPIDVPDPERATLGGAIACNVSGPRRYGYGTFRDYILGITTVNDRGEIVSAGGRVVKNVAGYDMMKLHTGALGTLGIVTQVTLKLRPVPEDRAVAACGFELDQLPQMLDSMSRTATRPIGIHLADGIMGETDTKNPLWAMFVFFEHNKEAVSWQTNRMVAEIKNAGGREDLISVASGEVAGQILSTFTNWLRRPSHFVTRATLPPSGVAKYCRQARLLANDLPMATHVVRADPGSGVVHVEFPVEDVIERKGAPLATLRDAAAEFGGNVVAMHSPSEWKKSLPVWGRPPADIVLQKAVKRALDPKNIFNPGRFVTDAF